LERTATPGVFKRGPGYVIRFRDPQGKEHKRTARTYVEARALKASLATDVQRGEYRALSGVPFEAYAAEWLSSYGGRSTRGLGESTRATYRWSVDKATAYFGNRRLAELEPRDVRAYVGWLQDPERQGRALSRATVAKHLQVLKLLVSSAVQDGLLRHSPATHARVPRPVDLEPRRVRVLTREQLAAVLTALPDEWRLCFELLASTGLRIGELLELRWADVDVWKRRLHVRRQVIEGRVSAPKSAAGVRQVPLSPSMCRRLSRLQGEPDELLFKSPTGRHVDRRWLRRAVLDPATEKAGVSWVTPHAFRHTCASMLLAEGRSAVAVQHWLGHHSAGFTLTCYAHLLDDDALGDGLLLDGAADGAARPTSTEADDGAATGGESAA
jgi:integrase